MALLLTLVVLPLQGQEQARRILVRDAETEEPMMGVVLRTPDWSGVTDGEGVARIPIRYSRGRGILRATFVGYETVELQLPIREDFVLTLHPSRQLLEAVEVVTQRSSKGRAMVGDVLSAESLHRTIRLDLTDALQGVKGLSSIRTGTGEGVPVIHGLSGNRILLVQNGVRQEAQQWNADFGSRLHAGHAGQITVLKGAESVRYGSDALGGVIVVESPLLPYGGRTSGRVGLGYGTNGRSYGGDFALEGSPLRSLAYRIQGAYSRSGDKSSAHYLLNNTGGESLDVDLNVGWKGAKSLVELFYNVADHTDGIYFGAQMGSVDLLKERIKIGRPVETTPFTYQIEYPKHRSVHHNLRLRAEYRSEPIGQIAMRLAYQRDRQREYHFRRMDRSGIPSVSLTLDNLQGDLTWSKSYASHWSSEVGTGVTYINNYNQPGTGVVPLIPNYVSLSGGLYGVQKYHTERLSLEVGARIDGLYLNASGIDLYSRPYGGERRYLNATAMVGAHYHFLPSLSATTQLGSAWRAPHVAELWSEGLDAAGGLYLRGDDSLESERALKWITSVDYTSTTLKASIEGYLQWIGGYIYKAPTGEFFPVISGVYPLFQYRQTGAVLRGLDAEVEWHPCELLSYRVMGGMIWASERSTGRYLPYIPPFRLSQTLQLTLPYHRTTTTLGISHHYVAEQKRFDPEQDLIPYAPPAYHLFSLEAGTRIPLRGEQSIGLTLSVSNLLNKEYKEYTNLSRYYAHDLGRSVELGITYNF